MERPSLLEVQGLVEVRGLDDVDIRKVRYQIALPTIREMQAHAILISEGRQHLVFVVRKQQDCRDGACLPGQAGRQLKRPPS